MNYDSKKAKSRINDNILSSQHESKRNAVITNASSLQRRSQRRILADDKGNVISSMNIPIAINDIAVYIITSIRHRECLIDKLSEL